MATKDSTKNECVQGDENEDTVLSMVDVLQESEELEEEATAVLGDSDDKCCTYPLGYRGRQAVYACATCTAESRELAGICLACSYECHEGHQLYELYTKRCFRCDCGNSKFGSMRCKLTQDKDASNPDNKYNHNFRGLYCICNRPYPDPEDKIEDDMIQCVVCEDWFHGRHLGGIKLPDSNDYQETVCAQCMQGSCDFLWNYTVISNEVKLESVDAANDVHLDVEKVTTSQNISNISQEDTKEIPKKDDIKPTIKPVQDQQQPCNLSSTCTTSLTSENVAVTSTNLPKTTDRLDTSLSTPETVHCSGETKSSEEVLSSISTLPALTQNGQQGSETKSDPGSTASLGCKLKDLQGRHVDKKDQATFWPTGWRNKLCTCQDCKALYESRRVSFLTEESDTVLAYEVRGKLKRAGTSQYQMGMEALTTLDRVQQVEVLHEYNNLKASLSDYLQSFANQGKVVKRQDIDEFFNEMQSRKRQRVGNVQYFCR